jgi:cell division protein FtsL
VNRLRLVLLTAIMAALTGCASVQPWERDLHAREDMQPNQRDAAIDDHIYFSKEASSGGRGFAGGGCGCN